MEAMAIVLMLMKADHSMMELGKYKSMEECHVAMEIAKTQFKKGHLSCLKEGEKMKH
jgi:uncharacterized membrane protein|tara:strand:+ start:493 stop:663 length:171 start_codon:yes stop_codon:yes gene_type:complete